MAFSLMLLEGTYVLGCYVALTLGPWPGQVSEAPQALVLLFVY